MKKRSQRRDFIRTAALAGIGLGMTSMSQMLFANDSSQKKIRVGIIGLSVHTEAFSEMLNAAETSNYFPHPSVDTSDETVYKLEPDWAKAFNDDSAPSWIKERMPQRSAETPLVPSPWLDGASTLWQKIPESMKNTPGLRDAEKAATGRMDDLQKKLDAMFQKLNDLESTRAESNHIEIILFVLGGIFLLLLLDILVKQGTHAAAYVGQADLSRSVLGGSLLGGSLGFG
jgi:hypothetical protein